MSLHAIRFAIVYVQHIDSLLSGSGRLFIKIANLRTKNHRQYFVIIDNFRCKMSFKKLEDLKEFGDRDNNSDNHWKSKVIF